MTRILEQKFIQKFIKLTLDGYERNWHERNGGNLSYRIKNNEIDCIKQDLAFTNPWLPIRTQVKTLSNEFFLVTGSGKYFGNIALDPASTIGIIEIDELGQNYRICWGLNDGGRPTSELPSHLMNHEVKHNVTKGKHRVIYHAHPTNIIALTFVLPLDDHVFTKELWEMATECPVVFPAGVGVVQWMVPGGREIAIETSKKMETYDAVIWAHHGMFCSGQDFDETFGLMDTIEKAAEIMVKVLSIQPRKLQTISKKNFEDLAEAFNVQLNPHVLKLMD